MRYKANPDVVAMGLAIRSLYLVKQNIPFSASDAQVIARRDGQYIQDNKINARKEEPLTLLVHRADYLTVHIY